VNISTNNAISALSNAVEEAQKDKKRKELLDWLSKIDPSKNFNSAREKHESGTGDWLLVNNKDFELWKAVPNSLLWLNGKGECHSCFPKDKVWLLVQLVRENPF